MATYQVGINLSKKSRTLSEMSSHNLTPDKLECICDYIKKIKAFTKPFKPSKKDLEKLIDSEFLDPLIKINARQNMKIKTFKGVAKELYDDMVEEEEGPEYDEED